MKPLAPLLLCVSLLAPAAGEVILFDDFDAEGPGGVEVLNYDTLSNWAVTRGTVDLINDASLTGRGFTLPAGTDGLFLDLDGTSNAAARLESTEFELIPGEYRLEFDLGNYGTSGASFSNTMAVTLGASYSENFALAGTEPLAPIVRSITVPAAETARLVFDHDGGDNNGMLLDNVRLTLVPEGATFVGALSAAGCCLLRRRDR